MQVIKKNLKSGLVSMKLESQEDLWHLSELVSPGDLVSGRSERKIKIGGDEDRKATVVKKPVYVKIRVEKLEFHEHSDTLRLNGVVVEGPEDVPHGSHHTLVAEPGTLLEIEKEEWPSYLLERLKEAEHGLKKKIVMVIFDREEAIFVLLKSKGEEVLTSLKGDVSKKGVEGSQGSNFYAEISRQLLEYDRRLQPDHIIVASPSFWKDYLLKEIPQELKGKVVSASCSDVSVSAVKEVLSRPELFKVLENERNSRELALVEELLKAISKGEACYGVAECADKIEIGAVKELLVSYSLLRESSEHAPRSRIESLMRLAEKRGGKVHVLGSQSKLEGLGGIAGILRWKQ